MQAYPRRQASRRLRDVMALHYGVLLYAKRPASLVVERRAAPGSVSTRPPALFALGAGAGWTNDGVSSCNYNFASLYCIED